MKHQEEISLPNGRQEIEQADDVATLYSWANLQGAKYRDFSASREHMREQMRQRMLAEQARVEREEAQAAAENGMGSSATETVLWQNPEPERRLKGTSNGNGLGAHREAQENPPVEAAAWPPVSHAADPGAARSGADAPVTRYAGDSAGHFPDSAGKRPATDAGAAPRTSGSGQVPGQSVDPTAGTRYGFPAHTANGGSRIENGRIKNGRAEDGQGAYAQPAGPAWLTEHSAAVPVPETLQQSRERVASRWFALRGVLGGSAEPQRERAEGRLPVTAVFSLAGGVGKTSLVAGMGRALAALGERVLLADSSPMGLLPFYFGAREARPGVVRTFSGAPSDPPIRLLSLDMEREGGDAEFLKNEIARGAQDAGRVLIDVATGSLATLVQALRFSPVVLVPVVPDMTSVVTLEALEGFFRSQENGKPVQSWYVLNQFDASLPLHLDVREVLRQKLGERLLSFPLHRSAAVSEALAEGMTVMDYAPGSPAAEDLMNLVNWVRSTSVAAAGGHRGVRWSER